MDYEAIAQYIYTDSPDLRISKKTMTKSIATELTITFCQSELNYKHCYHCIEKFSGRHQYCRGGGFRTHFRLIWLVTLDARAVGSYHSTAKSTSYALHWIPVMQI